MSSADVVVVGAGPAGCAAATTLAREGRHVLLVDRARFPRDKTCGDGLTTGALRLLEDLGLEPGAVASWQPVHDVILRSPAGREVTFPLPRGTGRFAAVARRADLDGALLDVTRTAGAEVLDGHAMTAASVDDDRAVVAVEGVGEIHARYAIGADGAWSPLRKALGAWPAGYRGEWLAFRQYVGGVGQRAASRLWVSFEADLLPGYLWSFPLPDGQANVGFGVQRGGRWSVRQMAQLWRDLMARPHVRELLGPTAQPEGPVRAWPIPAAVDRLPVRLGRALFVGDAAAATDPMTGEGIGQALQTGVMAARAVLAAGPHEPEAAGRRYQAEVERTLVPDHRMSTLLLKGLATPAGAERSIRLAGASPWTRRNFARWLFEDEPRAVLATPRRWHRGFLARPGAYRSAS